MGITKDQVENLINKFLEEGKLQGGLKTCDGGNLQKGAKVVLCDTLVTLINNLMKEGLIDVVKDVEFRNGELVVTDGTGRETQINLPFLQGVKTTKTLVITLPDRSTVKVPIGENFVTEDMFGNTIRKGVIADGKFDVNVAEIAGDGISGENDKLSLKPAPNKGIKVTQAGAEVDLTNLVDGETVVMKNGKLSAQIEIPPAPTLPEVYNSSGKVRVF